MARSWPRSKNDRQRRFLESALKQLKDWCERGDSNPHGFTRQILSLVRLPIPPLSHFREYSLLPLMAAGKTLRPARNSSPDAGAFAGYLCNIDAMKVIWITRTDRAGVFTLLAPFTRIAPPP